MISTILTSVLGALLLAAIFAALKSRWLYLVVPTLYLKTPISSAGQIVSLTLMNNGLTGEEDVAVRLKDTCKYELLASSKSTLTWTKNTLAVPRLARHESATVLLLVEGKTFDKSDIETFESKGGRGKVVTRKEEVVPLWKHLVIWPGIVFILAEVFVVGTMYGSEWHADFFDHFASQAKNTGPIKQLAGYAIKVAEGPSLGTLDQAWSKQRVAANLTEIVRRGDVLTLTIELQNKSDEPVTVGVTVKSSADGRGPVAFGDTRIDDVFLPAKEAKSRQVQAFLPEDLKTKILIVEYHFAGTDTRAFDYVTQTITF